jgi:hypothetical protein
MTWRLRAVRDCLVVVAARWSKVGPPDGWSPGRLRLGGSVEFGGNVGGLGRADPLEYLRGLPQESFGVRGLAGGQGAAAQAGQRVSLGPGAGEGAGQFQGLLVAPFSLREVAA